MEDCGESHRIIKKAEWLAFGKIKKTATTRAALGSREQGLVIFLESSVGVALLHSSHFHPWTILLMIQNLRREGKGPIGSA